MAVSTQGTCLVARSQRTTVECSISILSAIGSWVGPRSLRRRWSPWRIGPTPAFPSESITAGQRARLKGRPNVAAVVPCLDVATRGCLRGMAHIIASNGGTTMSSHDGVSATDRNVNASWPAAWRDAHRCEDAL